MEVDCPIENGDAPLPVWITRGSVTQLEVLIMLNYTSKLQYSQATGIAESGALMRLTLAHHIPGWNT